MTTAPHVPPPPGNLIVTAIFAIILGWAATLAVTLLVPRLKARFRHTTTIAFAVIALSAFGIMVQTRTVDWFLGGYFSSKTPRERLQDHFADFEERVSKDPVIRKALRGYPDHSARLQWLASRGTMRLDDATLRQRGKLMRILLSRLGDRACLCVLRRAPPTESDQREIEQAMVKLESAFVSEYMQIFYASMLAEVRKSAYPAPSDEDLAAAYRALEARIGVDAATRAAAGIQEGASDSECAWAARTIYQWAPTLAEPHATVTLRMMAEAGM